MLDNMPAIAYLRRSRIDAKRPGTVSHEMQLEAVKALAKAHGDDPNGLTILEDWGKSGRRAKVSARNGFTELLASIERGDVTAIYAYSLSRLGRSIETLAILIERCSDAKIPVRCADGYSPDVTNQTGALVATIIGAVHRWQAEWTRERAIEATALRRSRGDHVGPAPYGFSVVAGELVERPSEDVNAVVEAYRAVGSLQGAARRLTLQGAPTRRGETWTASSVRGMLQRVAPDLLPPVTSRRRVRAAFRLSGLLRCPHDGAMLTGRTFRGKWVAYGCRRAATDPTHPHPRTISEHRVLPWVQDEVGRLQVPEQVTGDPEAEARRVALEARRERVVAAFLDGVLDKVTRDAQLLTIADEQESLSAHAQVLKVPTIDWAWSPRELNGVLRAVFVGVELGPDLYPVRAAWMVPEWRS